MFSSADNRFRYTTLFAPDGNMGTLQWHFFRNWSLEVTFGDRGMARVNALWRKTY